MKKAAILLSGGVDSSVALALAIEQGYQATAYYLKIWLEDEMAYMGDCPWEEDLSFCRAICEKFAVPLKIINMQREYYNSVVAYSIEELKAGRTPSPDIMCNKNIKFGTFFEKCPDSFDKVFSGHYATIKYENGKYKLFQAKDPIKDQTYFLTYLSQNQLSKIEFPLGIYYKNEVRDIAKKYNLITADKKDSQGICFLGKIKFNEFVKFYLGEKKGQIIDIESEKVLGLHNGFWFHTIGQRTGLGLSGGPWYVTKKDVVNNIVFVSKNPDIIEINRNAFIAKNINWFDTQPQKIALQTKIRHGAYKYNCAMSYLDNKTAEVTLAKDDQGISPGQFSIFYDGDECLGGGVIELLDN